MADNDDKQQATASEQDIVQAGPATATPGEGTERAIAVANEAAMTQLDVQAKTPDAPEKKIDPIIAGERIRVSAAEIDRELMQIWKASTAQQSEDERSSISLLRAMNLIVYVDSDARAAKIDDVISQVTGRHPCRTILIVQLPGTRSEDSLEAWISAHCQPTMLADRYLCSEQVTIVAEGDAVKRVPNIALNLLVTDLPVFLWWDTGSPFEGYVRDHLMASIDRVIVDSALWDDPVEDLLTMARTAPRHEDNTYASSDFTWGRNGIWRDSTAQFFDATANRVFLDRLALIQVEYADGGSEAVANPIQALLYVGWLASRLKWSLDKVQTGRIQTRGSDVLYTFTHSGRPIQVVLRQVPATPERKQGIASVRLSTGGPDRATFDIKLRGDACTTSTVDIVTGEQLNRTRAYLDLGDAQLLDQELEIFGHDRIYDASLEVAAAMIEANPSLRAQLAQEAEQERQGRRAAFDPRF